MHAADIAYQRKHLFRAWVGEVAADRFAQTASVVSVTTLIVAFSVPTSNDIAVIIGSITALTIAAGGVGKVYISYQEMKQKQKAWDYEHPPKQPKMPDSSVIDEAQTATPPSPPQPTKPNPVKDEIKKARARRRKKEVQEGPPKK